MVKMMSSVDIIFPNQLFEDSIFTKNNNPKYLIEEDLFFSTNTNFIGKNFYSIGFQ